MLVVFTVLVLPFEALGALVALTAAVVVLLLSLNNNELAIPFLAANVVVDVELLPLPPTKVELLLFLLPILSSREPASFTWNEQDGTTTWDNNIIIVRQTEYAPSNLTNQPTTFVRSNVPSYPHHGSWPQQRQQPTE